MANRLAQSPSLYLRQHAANPVFWQPWDEAALQQAKAENKLLIISIGYAACHWCHVMEHESFMDQEVAAMMNAHFVSIKIDRESRPDLDALYMDALQILTGRGGWPLNVVCLPDGRPVYGGTYFPRTQWLSALGQLSKMWQQEPERVTAYANRLETALLEIAPNQQQALLTADLLQKGMSNWQKSYDAEAGGMLPAPKFPVPGWWRFMLFYSQFFGDEKAKTQAHFSLIRMAAGGMYDQLAGGFCRYSVDEAWRIPHFEKMLNDNAQMLSLYAEAYRQQPHPRYRTVVYASIQWLEDAMLLENGLYAASLDADSEGEEGKYYVWTKRELQLALNEGEYVLAEAYFDLQQTARWEGPLLVLQCSEMGADSPDINQIKEKLRNHRDKRIAPLRDEKALLAWNALLVEGLLEAYATFGETKWLQSASALASKLLTFHENGQWYRVNFHGSLSQPAFSEDLVYTAWAFFRLYQLNGQSTWLDACLDLVKEIDKLYIDEATGFLRFSAKQEPDWNKRLADVSDHVQPSPGSVYARLCEVLGRIYPLEDYSRRAQTQLQKMAGKFGEHLRFYPNWAYLGLQFLGERAMVHIAGKEAAITAQELAANYLPAELLLWSADEKRGFLTTLPDSEQLQIQRCVATHCELPHTDAAAYLKAVT